MHCSEKRVLVTGATGLIGKELPTPLKDAGFEIYAITIDEANPENGIHWVSGSVFDERFVRDVVASIRPTHLLNMAWGTTGDYLTSDVNYRFLKAGEDIARAFAENGGTRAVFAGTCFEYRFKDEPLRETDALDTEKFVYTHCKNALREHVSAIFKNAGVSFGYGRIFYAYGRGEAKTRLTGMVLNKLGRGEGVVIRSGPLQKDYIYSKDIAGAFVALLDSRVEGSVNICTGRAVSIHDFVMALADRVGRRDLVRFEDDCANQPPLILGDATRLNVEVGYRPCYSLKKAIDEIVLDCNSKCADD